MFNFTFLGSVYLCFVFECDWLNNSLGQPRITIHITKNNIFKGANSIFLSLKYMQRTALGSIMFKLQSVLICVGQIAIPTSLTPWFQKGQPRLLARDDFKKKKNLERPQRGNLDITPWSQKLYKTASKSHENKIPDHRPRHSAVA